MPANHGDNSEANKIAVALTCTCLLVAAIVVTSIADRSSLGSPAYWAWVLTGLQVLALRAASTRREWGWLLGASVQLPWIAYALVTAQLGFIPGCLVSGIVQAHGYMRRESPRLKLDKPTYA